MLAENLEDVNLVVLTSTAAARVPFCSLSLWSASDDLNEVMLS
jgi:hypothetical protein